MRTNRRRFILEPRHWLLVAGALAVATIAVAGDEKPRPAVKVDIQQVVQQQTVEPVDGITVSGQPNAEALEVFAASGYSTVIDLRAPGEKRGIDEAAVTANLGLDYVQLPVSSADDVSFERARELQQLIDESDGPVLVHCGSGNRVGALLALAKSVEGASAEEALAYGRSAGLTRLESQVRKTLESDDQPKGSEPGL